MVSKVRRAGITFAQSVYSAGLIWVERDGERVATIEVDPYTGEAYAWRDVNRGFPKTKVHLFAEGRVRTISVEEAKRRVIKALG